MFARLAPRHRMGSYLFFQSSGFFFPRLTNQNPLIRLLHATRSHVFFNDAHQSTSILKVGCKFASWRRAGL
jgi:hypothetical protein